MNQRQKKFLVILSFCLIAANCVAHEDGYWRHEPGIENPDWQSARHCEDIGMWLSGKDNLWYPIKMEHGILHYGLPIGFGKTTLDGIDCLMRSTHEYLRKSGVFNE